MPCGLFQEATFEPYKSLHKGMVYVDSETTGVNRVKEGKRCISYFLGDPSRLADQRSISIAVNSSVLALLGYVSRAHVMGSLSAVRPCRNYLRTY